MKRILLLSLSLLLFMNSYCQTAGEYADSAMANFTLQNYERAIGFFGDAIRLDSGNAALYYNRGRCSTNKYKRKGYFYLKG